MSTVTHRLRDLPLHQKLTLIAMVTSGSALLIAIVILTGRDFITFRSTLESDLQAAASVIGQNSTAAISFQDRGAATQNLTTLRGKPNIRTGCIYEEPGKLFASYKRGQYSCPETSDQLTTGFMFDKLTAYRPIVLAGKPIGSIYIESGLNELRDRLLAEMVVFVIVLLISALVAYLISSRLQRLISVPLLSLSETAMKVSRENDFSLRAKKETNDEVGRLVDTFNHMLEQVEEAVERLRMSDRLKDEFLATMSHELRTPLTSIIGWTRMLKAGVLSEEKKAQAIDVIDRNAELETRLVDDILDASRMISGKLEIDFEFVDLAEVLQSAVDSIRPSADTKGLNLITRFERAPLLRGNARRLQQVFGNLLSNAVKFTPEGGNITVALSVRTSSAEVRLSDTGIGINPDFLSHVFERFRQEDSSSTRKYGGLGLGLAIVRHLVQLHGGDVSAESDGQGLGSTFVVTLPLAHDRPADSPVRKIHESQTTTKT